MRSGHGQDKLYLYMNWIEHHHLLTYSHRSILLHCLEQNEITLFDVGTHDEVYRK